MFPLAVVDIVYNSDFKTKVSRVAPGCNFDWEAQPEVFIAQVNVVSAVKAVEAVEAVVDERWYSNDFLILAIDFLFKRATALIL